MTEETTSEQLVEIEGQVEDTAATEYTPPDGYRVLQIGEVVQKDDIFLAVNGEHWPAKRIGETVNNNRYIRRIEVSQPCAPCDSGDTGDTTISEQLAEIEGQQADTPATEYTLPEGWQEVPSGEPLKGGDEYHAGLNRYIRRTESQPEEQPQPQPIQVREGRWRTRHGDIRNVTPTPAHDSRAKRWPWRDAKYDHTWREDGKHLFNQESPSDLVEYLGPIEPDKTQELPEYTPPEGWRLLAVGEVLQDGDKVVNLSNGKERPTIRSGRCVENNQSYIRLIKSEPQVAAIEELRSEVSYVQRLLGESRQRVTQLEELVTSLRTINEAQEKAVEAAGKENTALRNQLLAVKTELASVAADRQRLRIELDAAQQVPADLPELRQLRLNLAEVTQDRDTYRDGYDRVLSDLRTIRETAKAEAIEAIVEWLVPIRTCGSQALATAVISNLPHIMRHLTGLEDEGIE